MKRKSKAPPVKRKPSPAQRHKVHEPPIALPGKPIKYLTSEGAALAAQSIKTNEALRKAGVILPKYAKHAHEIPDYSFITRGDPKMAAMGRSFIGAGGPPPIVWPDMKKLDEEIRLARAGTMTPETKARLSSLPRPKRNNGDAVALMLLGCKTLDDVYKLGAKHFKTTVPALKAKYKHLNNGQQRMVIGNRLRAMWKAGKLAKEAS